MTRVRAVFEGEARTMSTSGVYRLEVGAGSLIVDSEWPEWTVEELLPPRVWTDGDVAQHSRDPWTLTREDGRWVSSRLKDRERWTDDMVTKHLTAAPGWGYLNVLRYQAGEPK